jgi:iron complex outermembrane recepter protein
MIDFCIRFNKLVLTFFFVGTGFVFSQDCNLKLTGKIVDLHENSPIEGALIQVLETNETAISSANGVFGFENQCSGILTIKISHLNCEDLVQEVSLKKSTRLKLFMEHHIESLEEVIVEQSQLKKLSSTAKTFSLSERQRDQYSNRGLAAALEQISGVNNLKTGNNIVKPVIHGMFGSRVGIVYDGVLLENQQWGQDHAPNLDQNAFENIRLVKGAGTLKFTGDTPGGVIVLESKLPKIGDSLYGKTILNGMTNGRGLNLITSRVKSYQSGNFFKIQGTVKKNGDFSSPDYILSNTGNLENNFSFSFGRNKILSQWKMGYSFYSNEIGILRSSHIGNVDDLLRAIENDIPLVINPFTYDLNPPKQKNEHHTTSFQYSKRNQSSGKWTAQYSWQRNNRKEYDIRRGENKNNASIDLLLNTHTFNSNYEWTMSSSAFDTGVFLQIQDNYSNPETKVKRLIPDYLKYRYGSYFTATFTPSNDFNYDFGIRWERQDNSVQKFYDNDLWDAGNYEQVFGSYVTREIANQKLVKRNIVFNNLSFNGGIKFNISPSYELGFNFYYTQRAPDISEMFSDGLHHALATIEYGNPFLSQETTQKMVFKIEKKKGAFQYNFSPYLTLAQNYVIIEPEGIEQTIRGAFPYWEYRSVDATLKGFDFDLSYLINDDIRLVHSTSWIEGVNSSTKTPLINIPPLTLRNHIQFSIPRWKSFVVGLTSKNVFRQNQFPDNNFVIDVVENGNIVYKLVDISTPPSGYHDLGMELHWGPYSFFSDKISLSLIFENMLNASYRNYLNRLRFYADEMGRNVMLQVKIKH